MYQSYDLSRYFEGDLPHSTSFTVSDDDAINCAHMLAAGFNTISRNMMGDFVLAVVDTKAGIVQYDGKIEKIERPDPHTVSTSFKFEASTDADTMVTIFDNENGRLMFPGKLKFAEESKYAHVNRDVLESAYGELEGVKSVLFDAGVETIPADAGVRDLLAVKRDMSEQISGRDEQIAELEQLPRWKLFADISDALRIYGVTNDDLPAAVHELGQRLRDAVADRNERNEQFESQSGQRAILAAEREKARAELIEHVKRAYTKWGEVDPGRQRESLKAHLRGMLEVLSKYLVAIGEADADERHAVALRVCEIPEGNYLYDDA